MRNAAIVLCVMALGSCYQPSDNVEIRNEEAPAPQEECVAVQLGQPAPVTVSWTATKNNDPVAGVVEGTISGQGVLTLGGGLSLTNSTLNFIFDSRSVSSGNEVRDGRLQGIFLDANKFAEAQFQGNIVLEPGELSTVPSPGQQRRIKISGNLVMAGKTQSLTMAARIVAADDRIFITQDEAANALVNLRATFVLDAHVSELVTLANLKSIEPTIALKSEFNIQRSCK